MRKIIFIVIIASVTLAGAGLLWASFRTQTGTVRPEELSASDLAQIARRHITKLNISLPEDQYTVNVWAEEWRKGAAAPTIKMLCTMGTTNPINESLLFAFPTPKDPDWFFGLGGAASWGSSTELATPEGGFTSADDGPIKPDEDLSLGTIVAQQPKGAVIAGSPKTIDPRNDLTCIYKVRFCKGDIGNKPTWVDGRVVFSQWCPPIKKSK